MGSNPTPGATTSRPDLTVNPEENPVLLSLDGRGFYVTHYTAVPEQEYTRIRFELADPNTGEGGSAEALVDPRLLEALNTHTKKSEKGHALLIWIETGKSEVRWQLRKIQQNNLELDPS